MKQAMYYLTVKKGGKELLVRKEFADYSAAIAYTGQFYQATTKRSIIAFTTEVINGELARSYATLTRPESVSSHEPYFQERYHVAVKQDNSFEYDDSFFFLIETERGIEDALAMQAIYEADD